jgi:hypothetical protein
MPTLSEPFGQALGVTGWTGSVRTDGADGTLLALASANPGEPESRLRAEGRAFAVTAAGTQIALGDGLTPGERHYVHFLHVAADGGSEVVTTPPFVTPAFGDAAGAVRIAAIKRGTLQIAPEAAVFEAEAAGPGVSGPATRRDYDESFHKLLYVWDFGDPGAVSDKVTNLPALHNDLNRAYGKTVAHVFTRPGRFTVTCTVYDADGALLGSDRTEIEVADPDEAYAGERTILIDRDGRGDAARHPGARVVADWDAAWRALMGLGRPGRILLQRGTVTVPDGMLSLNQRYPNAHVSAWGEGPRPVLATSGPDLIYGHAEGPRDIVFQNIAFQGPWDSTRETGSQPTAFWCEQENDRAIVIDDCTFAGFGISLHLIDEREGRYRTMLAVHNCDVTDWGDYGAYIGRNPEQFVAFLGTAIHQHEDALMGGGNRREGDTNQQGPIRISNGGRTHISACDLFSRNGWSTAADIAADQPCLRWSTSSEEQSEIRSACIVERTAMEGGFMMVSVGNANGTEPYYGTNFVMDKCLLVGTARTRSGVGLQLAGSTIRNTIMVRPDTPLVTNRWVAWVVHAAGDPGLAFDPGDPVEIYGNTMVNLMDDRNRGDDALSIEKDIDAFPVFSFENNVAFAPNATGQQPEDPQLSRAPLATVGGVWRSRYRGPRYRDIGGSGALPDFDTRFATPPDTVGTFLPEAGSPVIDSASGRVPVDDFSGRLRGEDPDRGARER